MNDRTCIAGLSSEGSPEACSEEVPVLTVEDQPGPGVALEARVSGFRGVALASCSVVNGGVVLITETARNEAKWGQIR